MGLKQFLHTAWAVGLLAITAHSAVQITAVGDGAGYDISGAEVAGFRSTGTAKGFDVDGDGAYGTAGYIVFGGAAASGGGFGLFGAATAYSNASFVTTFAEGANFHSISKYLSYPKYDDPSQPVSTTVADFGATAVAIATTGTTGSWNELLTFAIDGTAPPSFRVGLMAGPEGNSDGRWDPTGLRISFEGGTPVEVAGLEIVSGTGMVFFDITVTDGTTGTFSIESQRRKSNGGSSISGVTFDEGDSIVVGYDFDAGASDPGAPTLLSANLAASPLASPMAISFVATVGDDSGVDATGEPFGSTNTVGCVGIGVNDAITESFADAVAGSDYVSFTVASFPGATSQLSRLTFKATKKHVNSVDEYAVTDASGNLIGSPVIITNVVGLAGAYDGVVVDLAGTALEFISGSTEIRIYAWGRGSTSTSGTLAAIDKITLYGVAAADPNQASYLWLTQKPKIEAMIGDIESNFPDFDAQAYLTQLESMSNETSTAVFDTFKSDVLTSSPAFDDEILFVVRKQYPKDHQNSETWFPKKETNSSQYNANFYGGSYIKKLNVRTGVATPLLYAGDEGVLRDPDLHFDGKKFLFAWRKNYDDEFHIYEMNVDGTGLHQLTSQGTNENGFVVSDGFPIYLADDSIAFVSSREPKHIPCNRHRGANIFRMDSDGANIHRISNNLLHDNNLSLGPDGKIYYDRWEYLDRDFGSAQGVWSCNPDGTSHMLVFGNNSHGAFIDARWIPGTQKFLSIISSCHDQAWGPLAVIDNRLGFDVSSRDTSPVLKVWPESYRANVGASSIDTDTYNNVTRFENPYSINGGVPGIDYARDRCSLRYEDPYPITENTFLVSRSTGNVSGWKDLQTALFLVDMFGNEIQLYAEPADPTKKLGCYDPVFIRPRERPIVIANKRYYDNRDGSYYIENVNKGTHMGSVTNGEVKYVRVVETGEKRNWVDKSLLWSAQGQQAPVMNIGPFENRRILGDVQVEDDGSVFFNVPADKLVYFQLLDEDKKMVQSMRSYITVQPGEVMGCVGCHDRRNDAPQALAVPRTLQALQAPPKQLEPFMGEEPRFFGFMEQVQPILDAKCVSCHDFPGTGNDSGSGSVILAGDTEFAFNAAYISIHHKHLSANIGGAGPVIFPAKSWGSHQSPLIQKIDTGHGGLTPEEKERIQAWVDLNSPFYPDYHTGSSSRPFGRSPLTIAEINAMLSPTSYSFNSIRSSKRAVNTGPMISYERPELSPILNGLGQAEQDSIIAYLNTGQQRLAASPQIGTPGFQRDAASQAREDFYQERWAKELEAREAILNGTKMYDPGIAPSDTAPARITLVGSNPLLLTTADAVIPELGYEAIDSKDGDLTDSVVRDASGVTLGVPGVYDLTYTVTDAAGNETLPVVRKVIVSSVPAGAYSGKAFVPRDAVLSEDGSVAFVTGKGSSLLQIVDMVNGVQSDYIDYAYNLTGIALGADEIYLTTDDAAAAVLILDRTTLQLITTMAGGHGAYAPVLSSDLSTLYVCNKWSKSVSTFDLLGCVEMSTIPLSGEPSSAVLSADGQTLYVGNLLPTESSLQEIDSAKINVIDLAVGTVAQQIALPNGSHSLYGLALSPDGLYLLGVHSLGKTHLLANQLDKGWQNTARLAVVRLSDHKLMADFMLDDLNQGAATPRGIAVADNFIAVSHSGTHELTVLDYDALSPILAAIDPDDAAAMVARNSDYGLLVEGRVRIPLKVSVDDVANRPVVGMGPSRVVPVDGKFLVLESFTDTMSIVDPASSSIAKRILLNLSSDPDPVHQGYVAFNDAEFSMHQWQSCASCHPGGRSDGLSWDSALDGAGNPMNTKSIILAHKAASIMARGTVKDVKTDIPIGTENFMNTVRTAKEHDDIYLYLESLKPVPSPYLEHKILSESARRGKAIFQQANCISCHSGAMFTDQKKHNVNTGVGMEAGEAFDTASLVEL